MAAAITTDQVWRVVESRLFAVLGMVTAQGEARTAGIVYTTQERRLYVGTDATGWKARWIASHPHVSLTVTIPKRLPFAPWVKIPDATITFRGEARLLAIDDVESEVVDVLFRDLDLADYADEYKIVEITPKGHFVTYGVGVPLRTMRKPEEARGRVAVT